jgi:hypothetical protein
VRTKTTTHRDTFFFVQNTEQNHDKKIGNKSSERVEQFKYLGTTLTNQNCIQEEIKSSLASGKAF